MTRFMKGALVEYTDNTLGPNPNTVIFQFNPESLSRTINIPSRSPARSSGSRVRENNQVGDPPYEHISLTAHFSAADQLNAAYQPAVEYGVGPQLAALERMVYPLGRRSGGTGRSVDAVGDASSGSGNRPATQPTPRHRYPNVLFVWGSKRILPVIIESMSINEQQFDADLNPIQAEVSLGLAVMTIDLPQEERMARGAAEFSTKARDKQADTYLENTNTKPVVDLINF